VTALARAAELARTARAVGVAIYDLRHDQAYGVRPNRLFKPASVIKLAVMVGAFQAREEGAIVGDRFERLRPALRRMITVSDNPSATFLVHAVGRERVNRAMVQLGLAHTHLSFRPQRGGVLVGSSATPAEIAQLLAKLARREVVSPRASNEMLLLLGASQRRTRIPAGLPPHPGLWDGNKTGTLAGLVHDSAIGLDSAAGVGYTLAIFTEGARSEAAANRLCIALSRAVYAALRHAPASGLAAHSPGPDSPASPSGAPPGSPSR
jgi:beta-lactamase class A